MNNKHIASIDPVSNDPAENHRVVITLDNNGVAHYFNETRIFSKEQFQEEVEKLCKYYSIVKTYEISKKKKQKFKKRLKK